jgi:hypothetical protein
LRFHCACFDSGIYMCVCVCVCVSTPHVFRWLSKLPSSDNYTVDVLILQINRYCRAEINQGRCEY